MLPPQDGKRTTLTLTPTHMIDHVKAPAVQTMGEKTDMHPKRRADTIMNDVFPDTPPELKKLRVYLNVKENVEKVVVPPCI